ncbi:MAG: hypothetical protein II649_07050 [Kiritimatiellae bacterium]|nr:hypothetical protein [Kiritimatiellia bacterium]
MKKLMIAAAVAAMTGGVFADACSDPETASICRAWDVSMSLKSLGPKKTTCKVAAESACDDPTTDVVYYLDNVTRKIQGYLWVCEYECGKDFNIVLWDSKKKIAIIPVSYDAVNFDEVYVYGKKATKVAGTIAIAGTDLNGNDTIDVTASGLNGKMVRGSEDTDCYVKSLSGYVAGKLAYIAAQGKTAGGSAGGLCDDPVEPEPCEETTAKILALCDACCFEGWCDADDAESMLPTVGTWKMKYNKKVSKGNKTISSLVPAYAL